MLVPPIIAITKTLREIEIFQCLILDFGLLLLNYLLNSYIDIINLLNNNNLQNIADSFTDLPSQEIIINLILSFILGLIISVIYNFIKRVTRSLLC